MDKVEELKFLKGRLKNVQDLEVKMGNRLENIEDSIGKRIDEINR